MESGGGILGLGAAGLHSSQFTVDELKTAVATARGLELPTATHAYGENAIRNAIEAEIDSIEHCAVKEIVTGGSHIDFQVSEV